MVLRRGQFLLVLKAATRVFAHTAPDITTLAEGYSYIAKLPCVDCPYLYQDTSTDKEGLWTDRIDDNALLLNVSFPFDAAYISVNNAPLLSGSSTLPRIYAPQVLQDYSEGDLHDKISSNEIDTAGPLFGLSYGYSLRRVTNSSALIFRFNVFGAQFTPPSHNSIRPVSPSAKKIISLDDPKQRVIELILLPRPLLSPGDVGPVWEIITARLSDRDSKGSKKIMKTMIFDEWDEFGRKGSPSHLASAFSNSLVLYVSSGFWGLVMAILGVLVIFVSFVVSCVVGWDWWSSEHKRTQARKGQNDGSRGREGGDMEKARGMFLSAGKLGMTDGRNFVGAGKSD